MPSLPIAISSEQSPGGAVISLNTVWAASLWSTEKEYVIPHSRHLPAQHRITHLHGSYKYLRRADRRSALDSVQPLLEQREAGRDSFRSVVEVGGMSVAMRRAWLWTVSVGLAACGSAADNGGPAREGGVSNVEPRDSGAPIGGSVVCDDSATVKIHARLSSSFLGMANAKIFSEIGDGAFWIDGRCQFWVHDFPFDLATIRGVPWPVVRTGKLTPADAERIATSLGYATWAARDGQPAVTWGFDAASIVFSDGRHIVKIGTLCTGCEGKIPADMEQIQNGYRNTVKELMVRGTNVVGPLRVTCVKVSVPSRTTVPWPLTLDKDTLANGSSSEIVSSSDEIALLQQLRSEFQGGDMTWGDIPIKSSDSVSIGPLPMSDYLLQVRDTLPFEKPGGGFDLKWN
jgi:hypothetical protein